MRVFVTVGTQLAFDRMIEAVDRWAEQRPDAMVMAQIGPTRYEARNIRSAHFIDPRAFRQLAADADVLVAHAGTGSIFAALELRKPIVVMPRRADLSEHRNDHQLATVARLGHLAGVNVARTGDELAELLSHPERLSRPTGEFSPDATPPLLHAVSDFIAGARRDTTTVGVAASVRRTIQQLLRSGRAG